LATKIFSDVPDERADVRQIRLIRDRVAITGRQHSERNVGRLRGGHSKRPECSAQGTKERLNEADEEVERRESE